jgi:hypothetical protein
MRGADRRSTSRHAMRLARLGSALLISSMLLLSGCAINRSGATVDPGADLSKIKTIHVVRDPEDGRGIDQLIADRFNQMGYTATTGPSKVKDVDAIATYVDKWMWDITMYMLELTIVVRDPVSDFPLASGNSLHTSLTRKSPKEMVEEVTTNIFRAARP